MREIIPTIFAKNKQQFGERLRKLFPLKTNLHIDFMDGKFVKAKGVKIKDLPNLQKYNKKFEAHLMTLNPMQYILPLKKKGFKKIIFHYEAVKDKNKILGLIYYIKNKGMKAIIAINPETIIDKIKDFLHEIDGVLLMGVHPGREYQKFIAKVYRKIKQLRKIDRNIPIQIDGGINLKTAPRLRKAGANILNSGSFVSEAEDSEKALRELGNAFR